MTVVAREFRELPVGLVDDPEIAMRETFDDEAFRELMQSISEVGLQVPIIVEQRGDRYRVVAGHRRICAARALHLAAVMCDVRQPSEVDAEAIKVLENDEREAVNAAEAALYLHRLYVEKCEHDVDRVCALTRRSRKYVEDRLNLVIGDEEVFDALKQRLISLSVAKELNRIKDRGYRRLHLDAASKFGMTAAAATDARKKANFAVDQAAQPAAAGAAADATTFTPSPVQNACYICHRTDHPERMRYVVVHEHCDLAIGDRVLSAFRQSDADAGTTDA